MGVAARGHPLGAVRRRSNKRDGHAPREVREG